jgi:DNA (cytosine-5)-methyltransferase 1
MKKLKHAVKDKIMQRALRALDLFAGVGGSTYGTRLAGVDVVAAVDCDAEAHSTYEDNHPGVHIFRGKCENLSPREVRRRCGSIDLIIASPECTSHTCAKGNARRSEKSRETAFQVCRFAAHLKPRWIVVENVVHMRSWRKYADWIKRLEQLGYRVRQQVLNAAEFGVPQSRKRLFVLCDRLMEPPKITARRTLPMKAAATILNSNGAFPFSPLKKKNRARPTLDRAERAMRALGPKRPFIIVYYGTDGAGGWQHLNVPLRTITTVDRFAFVRPNGEGHEMRMLQVPELQKAMGFPSKYKLHRGTRRTKIKLLGNAVCPPVMRAVVRRLTASGGGDRRKRQRATLGSAD